MAAHTRGVRRRIVRHRIVGHQIVRRDPQHGMSCAAPYDRPGLTGPKFLIVSGRQERLYVQGRHRTAPGLGLAGVWQGLHKRPGGDRRGG